MPAIRAYCTMRGLNLVEIVFDEGVSGGQALSSRKGGQTLLNANANAIVSYKLDRLFKDAADCLVQTKAWDTKGIALHLIDLGGQSLDTSSAMGRFFLTVMAGAAELERNQIRERTKATMASMRERNQRVGSIPYGYSLGTDEVHLIPNPIEQRLIEAARGLQMNGMSLRVIARELNSQGFRNRRGEAIHHPTVRNLLAAPHMR